MWQHLLLTCMQQCLRNWLTSTQYNESPLSIGTISHETFHIRYSKVVNSRLSRLVAHFHIFRLFINEEFDAYVLWHLAQRVQNWIVDWSTARNITVLWFECPNWNPNLEWTQMYSITTFKSFFKTTVSYVISYLDKTH